MLKSLSTSLIARGILAVTIGIIALAWSPWLALVILFAIYAFIAAGPAGRAGVQQPHRRPGHRAPAARLADLAAGAVALAWPGPTALVPVLIVGVSQDLSPAWHGLGSAAAVLDPGSPAVPT